MLGLVLALVLDQFQEERSATFRGLMLWVTMLHLETTVSRKTPLDGRLEIPESLAVQLSSGDLSLALSPGATAFPVRVEAMACTCAKGAGGNHVHHFLTSESLKSLPAGSTVRLDVDLDRGSIGIAVGDRAQ